MLQRLGVLLCAAAVAVACSQSDAGITTKIKAKMAADDTVKAYQIDVTTQDRVVTLTGKVETATAKEQAVAIARNTEGVRDIIDHLTVDETAATTGVGIDDKAEQKAREGVDKTKEIARETGDKMREGANKTGRVMTDGAITTAVKSKLLADPTVGGLRIDVDTRDGVVTLNGTVATRTEADRALTLARETGGVNRVIDNLTVRR
jgi:hyperosmotically inducible protein